MDPDEDRALVSNQEFEDEIAVAARGDWEALGLDAPGSKFEPVSVDEFMRES